MQLPRPVQSGGAASGGGARYNVVAQATVEPSGALVARVPARDLGWLARRIVLQGPPGSICRLYTGEPGPTSLADGSQAGELDVADYYQPLYVERSLPLVAVWSTGTGEPVTGEALLRVELEEVG